MSLFRKKVVFIKLECFQICKIKFSAKQRWYWYWDWRWSEINKEIKKSMKNSKTKTMNEGLEGRSTWSYFSKIRKKNSNWKKKFLKAKNLNISTKMSFNFQRLLCALLTRCSRWKTSNMSFKCITLLGSYNASISNSKSKIRPKYISEIWWHVQKTYYWLILDWHSFVYTRDLGASKCK